MDIWHRYLEQPNNFKWHDHHRLNLEAGRAGHPFIAASDSRFDLLLELPILPSQSSQRALANHRLQDADCSRLGRHLGSTLLPLSLLTCSGLMTLD